MGGGGLQRKNSERKEPVADCGSSKGEEVIKRKRKRMRNDLQEQFLKTPHR